MSFTQMEANDQTEFEAWESETEPSEPSLELPAVSTDFLPGSESKIEVLRSRFERGEGLWHPSDMTYERYGRTISENLETIFPAQKNGCTKSRHPNERKPTVGPA